jgi:hypothetical protein
MNDTQYVVIYCNKNFRFWQWYKVVEYNKDNNIILNDIDITEYTNYYDGKTEKSEERNNGRLFDTYDEAYSFIEELEKLDEEDIN